MPKMLPIKPPSALVDDAWLDGLERAAFEYFPKYTNPSNGLVADTSRDGSPVSIAVVGLALSAYPVAVERGWIARDEALSYCLAALRFFSTSDQSGTPTATGHRGFYFHFLDIETGARVWRSELSMIDTALLIAGVLAAGCYFSEATRQETELRELADALYRRIDWPWSQDGGETIRQGWKPECGFLHYGWEGYSEAIVLYALAMGSPTYPITSECYKSWTSTYQWENLYDFDFLYAGPLFVHHYSHAWIDFRGIRDSFMREKHSDYFENSRRAAYIQREYAQRNPYEFVGYNQNCWGLTACDGPTDGRCGASGEVHRVFGYAARGVPFGPDDGTLSCPTVLASLPFAPDIVVEAARFMMARYPEIISDGRLATSFNPTLADSEGRPWVSAGHYGLDQGVMLMMIENYRTGWLWALMRGCPYLTKGLRNAGFAGGWLDELATTSNAGAL